MIIYTVHAYRFGDREQHSYIVGVYTDKTEAMADAYCHEDWRSDKYVCEVREFDTELKLGKPSYDMISHVIKPLPKVSGLKERVD